MSMLVSRLIGNLLYRLESAKTSDKKLLAILETPIQFKRIHPFSNGNGRTGSMVMLYSLLQEEFPPFIILKETTPQYIEFLANQDVTSFFQFAKEIGDKEEKRMQAFLDMDEEQIKYD